MYTRIALRASKISYSDVGEGGVAVNCTTQYFLYTLHLSGIWLQINYLPYWLYLNGYIATEQYTLLHISEWNGYRSKVLILVALGMISNLHLKDCKIGHSE